MCSLHDTPNVHPRVAGGHSFQENTLPSFLAPCNTPTLKNSTSILCAGAFFKHQISMPDEAMFRPPMNRSMRTLDRTFFKKTIPTSAARILDNKDISLCRKILEKSKEALIQNRIAPVRPDPVEEKALRGGRCIILRPEIKHDGSLSKY